jgi:hypothetical protein
MSVPYEKCPECGKVFFLSFNLKLHIQEHEEFFNPSRRKQI